LFIDAQTKVLRTNEKDSWFEESFKKCCQALQFPFVIPATWEVEIRRIKVRDQPGQKVSKSPISISWMVAHTCGSSHMGSLIEDLGLRSASDKNVRPYPKITKAKKGSGHDSTSRAPA
jgi:hypothetical protein